VELSILVGEATQSSRTTPGKRIVTTCQLYKAADFSVVLFRSDCRLFSEKNRMKAHINQWLLTMPYPLEHLSGAIRRGHTMDPEGQRPSQWRCLTKLPREMYSQPIVHKALSRGTICKSACILAEITIRKSQVSSRKGLWPRESPLPWLS